MRRKLQVILTIAALYFTIYEKNVLTSLYCLIWYLSEYNFIFFQSRVFEVKTELTLE